MLIGSAIGFFLWVAYLLLVIISCSKYQQVNVKFMIMMLVAFIGSGFFIGALQRGGC